MKIPGICALQSDGVVNPASAINTNPLSGLADTAVFTSSADRWSGVWASAEPISAQIMTPANPPQNRGGVGRWIVRMAQSVTPCDFRGHGPPLRRIAATWGERASPNRAICAQLGVVAKKRDSFPLSFSGLGHWVGAALLRPTFQATSSPGTGGFPRPARFRSRLAFATPPRCPRTRKYSSVRKADNFSATATLMNWLRATPSVSETRRASSNIDSCRRKATLLLLMFSNLPPRIAWPHHSNPELASGGGKVTHVESDQPISLAVDRRFQHHFVGRILQSRAPQKPEVDRNRHLYQSVENIIHLTRRQAARVKVLRPRQNRFVLDNQGDRRKHLKCTIKSADQQSPGGSLVASQSSYNDVGIENQTQKAPPLNNITCDSTITRADPSRLSPNAARQVPPLPRLLHRQLRVQRAAGRLFVLEHR